MMIPATSLLCCLFPTSVMITPTITAIGASVEGLNIFAHSPAETNKPVMTTITVVAEELWIIAVTNAPSAMPISLFCVSTSRIFFILEPAACCKPSAMMFMP